VVKGELALIDTTEHIITVKDGTGSYTKIDFLLLDNIVKRLGY
jgi:hypothetical protein